MAKKKTKSKEKLAAQKLRTAVNKKNAWRKHLDSNLNDKQNLVILKRKLTGGE